MVTPPVLPVKGALAATPLPTELPATAASLTMVSMQPPLLALPARMALPVLEAMPHVVLVRPAAVHVITLQITAVPAACLTTDMQIIPVLLAPTTRVVWEET